MAGVEILSTEQVVTDVGFNWTVFWITASAFIAVGIIFGIFWMLAEQDIIALLTGIFTGILLAFIVAPFISSEVLGIPVDYETRYKVTVNESVSMNEFLDKYEILDLEGKIFTVRERKGG